MKTAETQIGVSPQLFTKNAPIYKVLLAEAKMAKYVWTYIIISVILSIMNIIILRKTSVLNEDKDWSWNQDRSIILRHGIAYSECRHQCSLKKIFKTLFYCIK